MIMYKVLLVDDENMLLDSLEISLSTNDMEIAGKAHDGNEALEILKGAECDIAYEEYVSGYKDTRPDHIL